MRLAHSLGRYERKHGPPFGDGYAKKVAMAVFLLLTVLGGSFAVIAAPSATTILGPDYLTLQGLYANPTGIADGSFWYRADNNTLMWRGSSGIGSIWPVNNYVDGSILSSDLANFIITNQKINVNAVNSTQVIDGSISPADLATGSYVFWLDDFLGDSLDSKYAISTAGAGSSIVVQNLKDGVVRLDAGWALNGDCGIFLGGVGFFHFTLGGATHIHTAGKIIRGFDCHQWLSWLVCVRWGVRRRV